MQFQNKYNLKVYKIENVENVLLRCVCRKEMGIQKKVRTQVERTRGKHVQEVELVRKKMNTIERCQQY